MTTTRDQARTLVRILTLKPFPLTMAFLSATARRDLDTKLDVEAVSNAVAAGRSAVALEWTVELDRKYPVREAAEILFAKAVRRAQQGGLWS